MPGASSIARGGVHVAPPEARELQGLHVLVFTHGVRGLRAAPSSVRSTHGLSGPGKRPAGSWAESS